MNVSNSFTNKIRKKCMQFYIKSEYTMNIQYFICLETQFLRGINFFLHFNYNFRFSI